MAGTETFVEVGGRRLRLTNLDKVIYPETGTTKGEVLDYYSRVSDVLIPHARDRAATRKRWVSGTGTAADPGPVFFEKNVPASAPEWIARREIQHSDHVNVYPLVNDLATLVWIAQQAALEIHVPQWRFGPGGARQNPDRMVLDLDPGEGAGLAECAEVARLVRAILSGMGLNPLPVTSGSKGIHLYAALDGRQTSDEVSAVAHELARSLEADHPDLVVSDMKKSIRGGKVLVDWSQNNAAKTTIVPYSLRGRIRPTVAAPRTWRELASPSLTHLEFTDVLKRVEKKGDLLADLSASHRTGHHNEALGSYRSKRDSAKTPEPMGDKPPNADPRRQPTFVIQEHHARRLHYDFRLERDGVLVSWAVPKGIPLDDANHLAVHVEDHPLEYGQFEGTIPRGEYGAGTVTIWDRGIYEEEKFSDHEVVVIIHGEKHGSHRLALIRTTSDSVGGAAKENWLMHRMKDQRKGVWSSGPGARAAAPAAPVRRNGKTVVGTRTGGAGTVRPMLATLGDPADFTGGDDWAYEMKWDGYRAIATVTETAGSRTVELRSRNGLDLTPTFPELAELADAVEGTGVFDGEIVALDENRRPSFELIQRRSGLTTPRDIARGQLAAPVALYLFDVLSLGGGTLTSEPYSVRRERLVGAVHETRTIVVPPELGTELTAAIATSRELGLEGIMAKRRSSPYREGKRSRDWIKIKHTQTQDVIVVGWRPGKGHRSDSIGSLLLGVPDGDGVRYVGRVGSGFSDGELQALRARLDRISSDRSSVRGVPTVDARDAHWVSPTMVAEVEYGEATGDGRLRHPVWRGWRNDVRPDEVRWESR
ncbi:MAG TPA: ATP-dependent DNA ligase [Pseudolysinimonas sp.]|nr:ATP-dependent DNA ligase [Pseudolysinimonas sp.]